MFKKTFKLIIGVAIVALIVLVLLQAARHPKINNLRTAFKDKFAVLLENLAESISPARKRPLTTIELEGNLKANLAVPFASFNQRDWQWFWHLLYGRYTQDSDGWPKRKRQLTKEEIQNILADSYRPFGRFSPQQWEVFWQRILKRRVFKEK